MSDKIKEYYDFKRRIGKGKGNRFPSSPDSGMGFSRAAKGAKGKSRY